jgi:hypothetical protein
MNTTAGPNRLDCLDALSASVMAECRDDFLHLDDDESRAVVDAALSALVGMAALIPNSRWDEQCHQCEVRIGDHTVDGRCPK